MAVGHAVAPSAAHYLDRNRAYETRPPWCRAAIPVLVFATLTIGSLAFLPQACAASCIAGVPEGAPIPVVPAKTAMWEAPTGVAPQTSAYAGYGEREGAGSAGMGHFPSAGGSAGGPVGSLSHSGRGWVEWNNSTDPPAREWASFSDDPAEAGVLLFGGRESSGPLVNDTWLFHQGAWSELCSGNSTPPSCGGGPSPRRSSLLAYDAASSEVVLFGGTQSGYSWYNDTWVFAASRWTNVSTAVGPAPVAGQMTYDAANGSIVWFGDDGTTWAFWNRTWHQLHPNVSPGGHYGSAFFYDTQLGADLLWGWPANETWAFRNNTWSQLRLSANPPGGFLAGYGYDSIGGYGLVFAPQGPPFGGNWTYAFENGTWVNITSEVGPAPPDLTWPALSFDSSDGYFVLLEWTGMTTPANQTWLLTDPLATGITSTARVADIGQNITLEATATGGIRPYSFELTDLPNGCGTVASTSAESRTILCSLAGTAGTYYPAVNVTDSMNDTANASVGAVVVNPRLTLDAMAAPNPVTEGVSVHLQDTVGGGTSPFVESWRLSDGASANGSQFDHTFASPGTYEATVSVMDAAAAGSNVTLSITVNPNPVARASISSNVTDVGVPLTFSVSPTGGTAPLTTSWILGDGAVSNLSVLTHYYPAPSTYRPSVWVNDSLGASTEDRFAVTVNPDPVATVYAGASSVHVGEVVSVHGAVDGGTGPFAYSWKVDGVAQSERNPSINISFAASGSHTVQLTLTDAAGMQSNASATISVASSGAGPTPSTPGFDWLPVLLVLVLAMVVIGSAWILYTRTKRRGSG